MGKIPVQDLAKKMGISNQDLVFKLRSIGVRVEGENAHIDTDMISAILQGKKLPQPREVILRDEPAAPSSTAIRRPPPPGRRLPPNPLRPTRPRTLIQKVEPRIQALPTAERPERVERVEPRPERVEVAERPASVEMAGARPERADHAPHAPPPEMQARTERVERPELPGPRPAGHRPEAVASQARPASPRPAAPKVEAEEAERPRDDKKAKRPKKAPAPREEPQGDLAVYRLGSLKEIEEAEDEAAVPPVSARRRRRVERRREETERTEGGKVLPFREAAPSGPVMISEGMTVRDFAEKLGIKSKDLIRDLFTRGILANINHVLEPDLAKQVAGDFGIETMVVSFEEEVQLKRELSTRVVTGIRGARAPVVTIMGHVDHGKTSLLDAIRESRLTEAEHGGITQHIGAYRVQVGERSIVFLDTPGHEAFTLMRARGARVTDLVVLVVAADDGVMPQTLEAIDHSRAAKVPIVVAINKVDKDNANPERLKKQLADHGLLVEDWGGEVVAVPVAATKRQGISELLEMITLTADLLELKANPEMPAQGTVLEARKDTGRGIVATVLVQDGALAVGDLFVSGATWGRVRAMADELGERIEEAGPSTPVEVTGFGELPDAGDSFQVVEDEAKARSISEFRRQEQRRRQLSPTAGKLSLEQLFDRIEGGDLKELPVIIKADVQGSVEVLKETVEKASTERVKVRVILAAAGAVSTNDVLLGSASGAVIFGFNVRPERNASELAEKEGVDLRLHTVIYELVEELRSAMAGLLEPTFEEVTRGRAEVREIFKVPKSGTVAGCHVVEGVVPRNAQVRLLRDNVVIHDGKIASLRRFKDDVSEVRTGFDCGIVLERYQDLKPGDVIEAYVRQEVAPAL